MSSKFFKLSFRIKSELLKGRTLKPKGGFTVWNSQTARLKKPIEGYLKNEIKRKHIEGFWVLEKGGFRTRSIFLSASVSVMVHPITEEGFQRGVDYER